MASGNKYSNKTIELKQSQQNQQNINKYVLRHNSESESKMPGETVSTNELKELILEFRYK